MQTMTIETTTQTHHHGQIRAQIRAKATQPKPGLPRRPQPQGLTREQLRKIVEDLIG
ncbi:hypothetical protein STVA_32200 [Allostella vacuolata]|nr:hypothetical protein STVA_32200 [Stella vacuolata]